MEAVTILRTVPFVSTSLTIGGAQRTHRAGVLTVTFAISRVTKPNDRQRTHVPGRVAN